MKDSSSLHKKVQEMIDCYMSTDPLREMANVPSDTDKDEAAIKWLALAALHGINSRAKKITIQQEGDEYAVIAEYRKSGLPNPGRDVGQKVLNDIREIMHLEEKEGAMPLALGMRDSSVELTLKADLEEGKEKVTLEFPK
jgi:hypothetical protein